MKRIIYLIAAFTGSFAVGLLCTILLSDNKAEDSVVIVEEQAASSEVTSHPSTNELRNTPSDTLANADTIKSIMSPDLPIQNNIVLSATTPKQNKNTYSFTAVCRGLEPGVKFYYRLATTSDKKVKTSSDGNFSKVPGIAGGTYKLSVLDNKTGKTLAGPITITGFAPTSSDEDEPSGKEVVGISASEFQSRMLGHSDPTAGGKISRNLRISVSGMKSGEEKYPSDIQDVRDKIDFGIWRSARVIDIKYDNKGVVIAVTIAPVY